MIALRSHLKSLATSSWHRAYGSSPVDHHSTTHQVLNQVPFFEDVNLYDSDIALQEALAREGAQWAESRLKEIGAFCGSAEAMKMGREANQNRPQLQTHDPVGNRIDSIDFHPAYHQLMNQAIAFEIPSFAWNNQQTKGAQVARAAACFLYNQLDSGVNCPLTMTYACVPVLNRQPQQWKVWLEKLKSPVYDPRDIPVAEKNGATLGMSMTEKQGGSDVRSNTTTATKINDGSSENGYNLIGHKWFTSAPMCDGFLTLAKTDSESLSCFLVPRWKPNGTKNIGFKIQRLKNKLGDHSNASSEVEYHNAFGQLVGEEGKGVKTIIEMVSHTRLDCTIGSASIMRLAVASAAHHAKHRAAFGELLYSQPIMQNVLCDLALEVESATALTMRTARAIDDAQFSEDELPFSRICTAIAKYWVCKRAPNVVYEAMECHGGNGYVEDCTMLPRLYRQAPLNSIWEGSGNVICLDVMRSIARDPSTISSLRNELSAVKGYSSSLDQLLDRLNKKKTFSMDSNCVFQARRTVEDLAIALVAKILVSDGNHNEAIAHGFCASRLNHTDINKYHNFGTLTADIEYQKILERILV